MLPPALLRVATDLDSDAKRAPTTLTKDSRCWYTRGGARKLCRVINVHHDDDPPYYTVEMDGVERSTVRAYLTPLTFAEAVLAGAGPIAEGRRPLELQIAKVGPLGITLENESQLGAPPRLTAPASTTRWSRASQGCPRLTRLTTRND